MIPFRFHSYANLDNAVDVIDHQRTVALGGGTTLVDLMKLNVLTPEQVVYVKPLLDSEIRVENDRITIGGGCTMSQLAAHQVAREQFPALRQCLITAASPQIRNMATIAGNLLQRTRSTYFRHVDMPSDALVSGYEDQPFGTGTDAASFALLGNGGKLVGTYPGDFAITLVAFDGQIQLSGKNGSRSIPARDFFEKPNRSNQYTTALKANELITSISLPLAAVSKNSIYLKIRERSSYAFALASASVGLDLEGQGADATIREVRVGIGGLASIPWNSPEAVGALKGKPASDENFASAADAALAGAQPPVGTEFKITLAKRTIVRALKQLRDHGPLDDRQLWAWQHGRA